MDAVPWDGIQQGKVLALVQNEFDCETAETTVDLNFLHPRTSWETLHTKQENMFDKLVEKV